MDRLAAIKVFVAIADAGSLSAAGRRLGMPLTTVSRHLAALEAQIGVRLITRTTRDLALTEPGRHYLETCRRVIAELDAADLRLAGEHAEPQGELAVTAPVVFGRLHVLPVVVEFLAMYPLVTARMLLVDRVVDLIEEGLDIAVRIGSLPDSSLVATRLGAIRCVVCASPSYLAKRGTPASPQELAGHDCIAFHTLQPAERWSFAGAKANPRRGQSKADRQHGGGRHRRRQSWARHCARALLSGRSEPERRLVAPDPRGVSSPKPFP